MISSIINDKTQVVSGHSVISNKTKVNEYVNMLTDVRNQVNQMIKEGKITGCYCFTTNIKIRRQNILLLYCYKVRRLSTKRFCDKCISSLTRE